MSHSQDPEPAAYIEQAARFFWDERGSFGCEVGPRTARDMSAEEHFWSDYTVVPLHPPRDHIIHKRQTLSNPTTTHELRLEY